MADTDSGKTSKTEIYRQLRREIITGRRQPGERLAIDDLKKRFGTSVTPVRDALQMLSQEALITIKPRSGYFVTRITLKELSDMLDLREILELAAVTRAAARISDEQIQTLRCVHQDYSGDDDISYTRYTDENRSFHYLLAEASGNHELAVSLGHLHDRLARFMVMRHGGKTQLQTHQQLIDRLAAHDVSGAIESIEAEMTATRQAIMEKVLQVESAHWHLNQRTVSG